MTEPRHSGRMRAGQLVVVIDEDAAYRATLAAALAGAGYHVIETDTADDGIAAATREHAALLSSTAASAPPRGTDGGSVIAGSGSTPSSATCRACS